VFVNVGVSDADARRTAGGLTACRSTSAFARGIVTGWPGLQARCEPQWRGA